ncbi:hypothetical protein [Sulfurimonas sp.]|nr:hypothetical protein [Sulfurimonas sp.]
MSKKITTIHVPDSKPQSSSSGLFKSSNGNQKTKGTSSSSKSGSKGK